MNMLSKDMKKRSAAAALGSLRAEGLSPSARIQKQAERYANGQVTKRELRASTLKSVKAQLKG